MNYPRPYIRDISKYDDPRYARNPPPILWNTYDGIIIRCFDGTGIDPVFYQHRQLANEYKRVWWPYMFYDFRYAAFGQVTESVSILGDDAGYAPLCIDVEEWGYHTFPKHDILIANLKVMHDEYKSITGMSPIYYFSAVAGIREHLIPVPQWLLNCQLWVADWRGIYPEFYPWDKWTLHQYQGDPDLNHYNGTVDEYIAWLLKPPPEPIPPQPPPNVPEYVYVNYPDVRLRNEPSTLKGNATIIGKTYLNAKLYVEDIVKDEQNRDWYQLGVGTFIAAWLTRLP